MTAFFRVDWLNKYFTFYRCGGWGRGNLILWQKCPRLLQFNIYNFLQVLKFFEKKGFLCGKLNFSFYFWMKFFLTAPFLLSGGGGGYVPTPNPPPPPAIQFQICGTPVPILWTPSNSISCCQWDYLWAKQIDDLLGRYEVPLGDLSVHVAGLELLRQLQVEDELCLGVDTPVRLVQEGNCPTGLQTCQKKFNWII